MAMTGFRFKLKPTLAQSRMLSHWMACTRLVHNAKCDDWKYMTAFARKFCPLGTYAPLDQTFAQYKAGAPWLKDCPAVILRNATVNWYHTMQRALSGKCGWPQIKRDASHGQLHLSREVFRLEWVGNRLQIFVGSKTKNIGLVACIAHRAFHGEPASLHITKKNGEYFVSFTCEVASHVKESSAAEHLAALQSCSREELEAMTIGIDRGVKIPIHAGEQVFALSPQAKAKLRGRQKALKRSQKALARQVKGSERRAKQKRKIAKIHQGITQVRKNFCHQSSHALVANPQAQVFVLEDLDVANMTKRAKGVQDPKGRWLANKAAQKSGLNRAILEQGWYIFESYLTYKAAKAGKVVFKVSPQYTSQECSHCGNIHPDNRKSQEDFLCTVCGYAGNADYNASKVIKQRAITLIMDSGTELTSRHCLQVKGRGAVNKTKAGKPAFARRNESSKKIERCVSCMES